ncbi:MAG: helix-turn-helix transcriptional regulator [Brevinematales bacterium]|nr:helix-turn-helix transcriptional regulator [Brevinematales bacterium]
MYKIEKSIEKAIAGLKGGEFEAFCSYFFSIVYNYKDIESSRDENNQPVRGVDAYYRLENGEFIIFQYTSQEKDLKTKIINDIEILNSDKPDYQVFKNHIKKVIVCINQPDRGSIIEYEKCAKKYGWEFELFTLHRLTKISIDNDEILKKYFSDLNYVEKILYFDCGARIKEVREERNLLSSEFIELVGFGSEKELIEIENREKEATLEFLQVLSKNTSVELEWLKHGKYTKYDIKYFETSELDYFIDKERHFTIYFCLEITEMNLLFLYAFTENKWICRKYFCDLNFDSWFDDHNKIKDIFIQLRKIFSSLKNYTSFGRIISPEVYRRILGGKEFFKNIPTIYQGNNSWWFDDICDIYDKYDISINYKIRYEDWFFKLKDNFLKYMDYEYYQKKTNNTHK